MAVSGLSQGGSYPLCDVRHPAILDVQSVDSVLPYCDKRYARASTVPFRALCMILWRVQGAVP